MQAIISDGLAFLSRYNTTIGVARRHKLHDVCLPEIDLSLHNIHLGVLGWTQKKHTAHLDSSQSQAAF
jgi:hypothetical protein